MATGDKLVNLDSLKTAYDASAKFTAPTEATSTASAAHATGEHFIYNGVLYIATTDIASGATITPNTNCRAVPGGIGGEVSELKSAITFNQYAENAFMGLLLLNWMKGGLYSATGLDYSSPNIKTDFVDVSSSGTYIIYNPNAKQISIFEYASTSGERIKKSDSSQSRIIITLQGTTKYIRLQVACDPSNLNDAAGVIVYKRYVYNQLNDIAITPVGFVSSGDYTKLAEIPVGRITAMTSAVINAMEDAPISNSTSGANVVSLGADNTYHSGSVQIVAYWNGDIYVRSCVSDVFYEWNKLAKYSELSYFNTALNTKIDNEITNRTNSDTALRNECTTIVSEGVAEEAETRQEQYGTLASAIATARAEVASESTRAQAAEGLKVNKPTTNPNGTNGQLLQTNGDGSTTWVNVGTPSQAQVGSAVDAWLDEHPEATTTVQDGSIAFAKLASDINKAQIVKNIEGLRASTADYVYVCELDSEVKDINSGTGSSYSSTEQFSLNRSGCWFWKHGNSYGGTERAEIYGGYLRTNGDVMFAMPDQGERTSQSGASTSSLFDIFASYFNRNNIVYGQHGTLFMSNCVADENNKFSIDCTSLVCAVTQGIPYDGSRYALGDFADNIPNIMSANIYPSTRGKYLPYINELVEYFAENKQLFTIKKQGTTSSDIVQVNGIQPGDILFSCNPNATGTEQDRWNSYYAVSHCAIVLAVIPGDAMVIIGQAGGSGNPTILSSAMSDSNYGWIDNDPTGILRTIKVSEVDLYTYAGETYQVFARPSYKQCRNPNNISGCMISQGSVTHTEAHETKELARIYPKINMQTGKSYSITIKGILPKYDTEGAFLAIRIRYYTSLREEKYITYNAMYHYELNGKEVAVPLFIPNDTDIDNIIYISVISYNRNGTGQTYRVDEIALVDGIDYCATGSKPITFTRDISFPNDVTSYSYENGENIFIDFRFSATGTQNQEILVGKIGDYKGNPGNASRYLYGEIGGVDFAVMRIAIDGSVYYSTKSTSQNIAIFRGTLG